MIFSLLFIIIEVYFIYTKHLFHNFFSLSFLSLPSITVRQHLISDGPNTDNQDRIVFGFLYELSLSLDSFARKPNHHVSNFSVVFTYFISTFIYLFHKQLIQL